MTDEHCSCWVGRSDSAADVPSQEQESNTGEVEPGRGRGGGRQVWIDPAIEGNPSFGAAWPFADAGAPASAQVFGSADHAATVRTWTWTRSKPKERSTPQRSRSTSGF